MSDEHPRKVLSGISDIFSFSFTASNDGQFSNIPSPLSVADEASAYSSLPQDENAPSEISAKGRLTDVSAVSEKANASINVTEAGITILSSGVFERHKSRWF